MAVLFTFTTFLAALLLFSVQPLVARLMLPTLGGSPSVWNTAMVFFQAVLLGGYLYSHWIGTNLNRRRWPVIIGHGAVLLLPLFFLPIALPPGVQPPATAQPILWLLGLLAVCVGIPFFVISTSSPLLQRLFALTSHRDAHDPYFLYAASNAGSLIALLSYPILIEPRLALGTQTRIWMGVYALLILCFWVCLWVAGRSPIPASETHVEEHTTPEAAIDWPRRWRWILLAFVPSSLMLSVTTYLSSEVVAIPLMWVLPLALYLLSFMVVFARRQPVPASLWARILAIFLLLLVIALAAHASEPLKLLVPLHLFVFFVAAVVCHGELARDRPAASHLTEFYGWMALGGVLGGAFNALLAPVLFHDVTEYGLTLVLLCMLLPRDLLLDATQKAKEAARHAKFSTLDLIWPAAIGLFTFVALHVMQSLGHGTDQATLALCIGLPALLCFPLSRQPLRFGLAIGALLLSAQSYQTGGGARIVEVKRSFFGIHRVTITPDGEFAILTHGSTRHGVQRARGDRAEPLSYYSRRGPFGDIFSVAQARHEALGEKRGLRVAVVGLGAGALAAYIRPGQQWAFYEIDPYVAEIAQNPKLFTYWSEASVPPTLVLGDARLKLKEAPDGAYDLIVLDAYSSDTIPVHLITREAVQLYQRKLAPGGLIGWHVSNNHFDLEAVIGKIAQDIRWQGRIRHDVNLPPQVLAQQITPSHWVALAADDAGLGSIETNSNWLPLHTNAPLWTDDFSSLWDVLWRPASLTQPLKPIPHGIQTPG